MGSADCKSVVARPWWFDSTRRHHAEPRLRASHQAPRRDTEIFAAIVEPARRLVANEEIAGAEPAGRSKLPTACRSKADRPLDKGQTVERYHARRPDGGRRQRDEPSGCDPEPSRCESGRSPHPPPLAGGEREGGCHAGANGPEGEGGPLQPPRRAAARSKASGLKGRQRPASLGCWKSGVQVAGARPSLHPPVSDNGSPRSW